MFGKMFWFLRQFFVPVFVQYFLFLLLYWNDKSFAFPFQKKGSSSQSFRRGAQRKQHIHHGDEEGPNFFWCGILPKLLGTDRRRLYEYVSGFSNREVGYQKTYSLRTKI
jgi:hypothetical protein